MTGPGADRHRGDETTITVCDCDLNARTEGIEPANARARGFREEEVIHFPDSRSVIYRCTRCGRRFEGWYEGRGFHFAPIEEQAPRPRSR